MKNILSTINSWSPLLKIGLTVLVFTSFGSLYWYFNHSNNRYPTITVDTGDITVTVKASGHVAAAGSAELYAPATGILTEVTVVDGQYVEAGDILAKLTSTATPQQQQAAYANYKAAQVSRLTAQQNQLKYQKQLEDARNSVLSAQTQVDRLNQDLIAHRGNTETSRGYTQLEIDTINGGLTSAQRNFDLVESQYLDAADGIDAARAAEAANYQSYLNLTDQDITAPSPGQIVNINYAKGDRVIAETSTKAEPLFVLTDFSHLRIQVPISERFINQVAIDQPTTVTFEALPDVTATGIVSHIDTIGQPDNGLVTYNATITLDQPSTSIRPGMSADVTITTQTVDQTTRVPNAALQTADQGIAVAIYSADGSITYIPITVGAKDDQYTQVISGIQPSTTIINQSITPD